MDLALSPTPIIQPLAMAKLLNSEYQFRVVRGDLIHPQISGNKWYKLKLNLQAAKQLAKPVVVSFGGAYSNHIHALAYAGQRMGIPTIGIIRGQWRKQLTPTLADAQRWGMTLITVSTEEYRQRDDEKWVAGELPQWLAVSPWQDHQPFVVPEGGSNSLGIAGVREWASAIYAQLPEPATLVMPVGSGGTLAGFAAEVSPHKLLGITVVKSADALRQGIGDRLSRLQQYSESNAGSRSPVRVIDDKSGTSWELLAGFEGRGYGHWDDAMLADLTRVTSVLNLPLEPVYSGKAFLALLQLTQSQAFTTRQVVFVHTGGLQGLRGDGSR